MMISLRRVIIIIQYSKHTHLIQVRYVVVMIWYIDLPLEGHIWSPLILH
jgi:hypothetical protein